MVYLLDANVFIQAKNQYYGFDIVPAFWTWLINANGNGVLFSVEKVCEEMLEYDDELSEWAKERKQAGNFFLPADEPVLDALKVVAEWVQGQAFLEAAINEFLQVADYYLVAHALAHGLTVVTQEVFEPNIIRKIKIPNACNGLGVDWVNTYAMLRNEGVQLGS
jgi:predicted nucleic acid-binding protein